MPNISASDYTTYLKYKAAALAYANNRVPRPIQTVDQVAPNVNIINTYVKTSEAALRVTPGLASITGLNYVRARPPNNVNHPFALSRLSYQDMGPIVTSSSAISSSAAPAPAPAPAPAGGSALFVPAGGVPRTAAWLTVAQPASQLAFDGVQDFTIECFVYLNAVQSNTTIFSTADGGSMSLQISGIDLAFYWGGGGGGSTSVGTTNALNTWIHFAVVRRSGVFTIYKNGTSLMSPAATQNLTGGTNPLFIGQFALAQVPGNEFSGYITNFRWVVGTAVYTANFAVPTTPLTAISGTRLLLSMATSGTLLTDSSTQNLTVTNVGTTWNALTPFP